MPCGPPYLTASYLIDKLGNLKRVHDGEAPGWLLELLDQMDENKKEVFDSLSSVPEHAPGVAACGKSTFFRHLILGHLFGGHPKSFEPGDIAGGGVVLYSPLQSSTVSSSTHILFVRNGIWLTYASL